MATKRKVRNRGSGTAASSTTRLGNLTQGYPVRDPKTGEIKVSRKPPATSSRFEGISWATYRRASRKPSDIYKGKPRNVLEDKEDQKRRLRKE